MLMQEHEQGNYEKDAHIFVGHTNTNTIHVQFADVCTPRQRRGWLSAAAGAGCPRWRGRTGPSSPSCSASSPPSHSSSGSSSAAAPGQTSSTPVESGGWRYQMLWTNFVTTNNKTCKAMVCKVWHNIIIVYRACVKFTFTNQEDSEQEQEGAKKLKQGSKQELRHISFPLSYGV